jgi:hypothetical protein
MLTKLVRSAIIQCIPGGSPINILSLNSHIGDVKVENRHIRQIDHHSALWCKYRKTLKFDIGLFEANVLDNDKSRHISEMVVLNVNTTVVRIPILEKELKTTLFNFMYDLSPGACILGFSLNSTPEKDKMIMELFENKQNYDNAVDLAFSSLALCCNHVPTIKYCEHETGNGISVYHYLFLCRQVV